jgi:small ligand-binding sensory domain FIST
VVEQYRKKPVVIEAVRWNGGITGTNREVEGEPAVSVLDWIAATGGDHNGADFEGLRIRTLEGVMTASPGDFIIKGVQGEFYPCKPDIFEQTYELAETVIAHQSYTGETQFETRIKEA